MKPTRPLCPLCLGTFLLSFSFIAASASAAPVDPGCAGSVDAAFDAGEGISDSGFVPYPGLIQTMAVQADGKLLVGGYFNRVRGASRVGLARLNPDGTLDNAFVPQQDYRVRAVAIQPDGQIVIGQDFNGVDGPQLFGLSRLNGNGSVDATFNAAWAPYDATAVALQPDGKILVAGALSEEGEVVYRAIRLLTNGAVDGTFATSNLFAGPHLSLLVQTNGRIVVAAHNADGSRGDLVRLNADGSIDSTFIPDVDAARITAAALQPDGKLLVGGIFESNGPAVATVIRLNSDGTRDSSFDGQVTVRNQFMRFGAAPSIEVLRVDAQGRILVGGSFDNVNGADRGLLARLLPNGTLDDSFVPTIASYSDDDEIEVINQMAWAPDGKLFIGGILSTLNGLNRNSAARLYIEPNDCRGVVTLEKPYEVASEAAGYISVTLKRRGDTTQSAAVGYRAWGWIDGDYYQYATGAVIFAVGETSKVVSVPFLNDVQLQNNRSITFDLRVAPGGGVLGAPSTARLVVVDDEGERVPGHVDESFHSPFGDDDAVLALGHGPDGKVMTVVQARSDPGTYRVARLGTNGSIQASVAFSITNGHIDVAVIDPADGSVLAGGAFAITNGITIQNVARVRSDGSVDPTFNPQVDGQILAMLLLTNGDILIGGVFQHVGGMPRSGVARVHANGTLDTTFVPPVLTGLSANVQALTVQPDGKVIMAGVFNRLDGIARTNIARLNANGSFDASFDAKWIWYNNVNALAIDSGGKLLVAGHVDYNPVFVCCDNVFGLVKLNSDGSRDPAFADFLPPVERLIVQPDDKIIVNGAMRLNADGTPDPDFFTGSGPYGNIENVSGMLLETNGDLVVAGSFYRYNELEAPALVRLRGAAIQGPGAIEFTATAATVNENEGFVTVLARRLFGSQGVASATFETVAVTATADEDFLMRVGTITFADGERGPKAITVPILDDMAAEGDETFKVALSNPTGGAVFGVNQSITVTITEDDAGVSFALRRFVVSEGAPVGAVRLARVGPTQTPFTVTVRTTNGTAVAGVDYVALSTNVAFASNQLTADVSVPIINNALAEPDKTVRLLLSNPSPGVRIGPRTNVDLVIFDDDRPHHILPQSVRLMPDGRFKMTLDVRSDSLAKLQASTNLVDWVDILIFYNYMDGPPFDYEDADAGSFSRRFYRLVNP